MVVGLLGGLAAMSGQVRADEEDLTDHLTLLGELGRTAAADLVNQLAFPSGCDVYLIPETAHPANWFVGQLLAQTLMDQGYGVVHPTLGKGSLDSPADAAAQPAGTSQQSSGPRTTPATEDSSDDEQSGAGDTDDDPDEEDEEETDGEEPQQNNQQQQGGQGPRRAGQGQQGTAQAQPGRELPEELILDLPVRGEICTFRVVECGVSYPWVRRSWFVGPRTFGRYASVKVRGSRVSQPGKRIASVGGSDQVSVDRFPGWAKPYLEGDEYPFRLEEPPGLAVERLAEPVIVAAIVGGLVYLFNQNQK